MCRHLGEENAEERPPVPYLTSNYHVVSNVHPSVSVEPQHSPAPLALTIYLCIVQSIFFFCHMRSEPPETPVLSVRPRSRMKSLRRHVADPAT